MKNKCIIILLILSSWVCFAQDDNQFIGEIKIFAGNFEPRYWAFCDGRLLNISQNTALFSILGVNFGGDGISTFALPDLREKVAIGAGQGSGLSLRNLGESGGVNEIFLTPANLPTHTHNMQISVNDGIATTSVPASGTSLSQATDIYKGTTRPVVKYNSSTKNVTLPNNKTSTAAASTSPVSVAQPYRTS